MADRSHLTPVPVTDRRGRSTTVYRDLTGRHAPGPAAVALSPTPPAPAAPGGADDRLPAPPPMDPHALRGQARLLEGWSYPPMRGLERVLTTERAGRMAMELARQLSSDGILGESEAHRVVVLGIDRGGTDNKGAALSRDCLRIAGEIAGHWAERPRSWPEGLVAAVIGARVGHPKRLSTRGELESLAAVVEFTMRKAGPESQLVENNLRGSVLHRRIRSRDLDALLRERPQDLDRIIAYVDERGGCNVSWKPVTHLRQWLDATEGDALGEGWI